MKKIFENRKLAIYVIVGIVVLQVVFLQLTMFSVRSEGGGGKNNASIFPIWIAVLTPIIVSQNKKENHATRTGLLWALVGLAVLVLVGLIIFYLKASKAI